MSKSDATQVRPPLPAVVHAQLGAGLSLDSAQLTAAALATFKHAASMANPKPYGIAAIHPDEFLRDQLDLYPGVTVEVRRTGRAVMEERLLDELLSDLRPPVPT